MKWLLFIPLFLFGMPKWYYNLESNNSDIIIGYGSGKSEKEAKNNALNDIVSQIAVTIKNEIQKTQSLNSNNYNKNIKLIKNITFYFSLFNLCYTFTKIIKEN